MSVCWGTIPPPRPRNVNLKIRRLTSIVRNIVNVSIEIVLILMFPWNVCMQRMGDSRTLKELLYTKADVRKITSR